MDIFAIECPGVGLYKKTEADLQDTINENIPPIFPIASSTLNAFLVVITLLSERNIDT